MKRISSVLVIALIVVACGGSDSSETTSLVISEPTTTSGGANTTEGSDTTTAAVDSDVPDPCSLLTVDEAREFDASISSSQEPSAGSGATMRICDFGSFTVTVGPGGPADSLRYEGMEEEGTEAVDIEITGAEGAVAYITEGEVWQVAAVGRDHSVLILLWSTGLAEDSPELDQLRRVLEIAFGRL